ncbi:MAG: Membrane protein [Chitinophagaceae bacterium]|nr:Membrane protein [Chitinophagaceae bacterium]
MKIIYNAAEHAFEKLTDLALKIYGNSLTFLIALIIVIVYLADRRFYKEDFHDAIRDIILCITFLSFFIIQKAFNKYTAAINLKMNELIATHENASNELVSIENKTEAELKELSKEYEQLTDDKMKEKKKK